MRWPLTCNLADWPGEGRERDEHGSVLIFTAIILTTLVTIMAFTLGVGKESDTKRYLQLVADVAARDAIPALGSTSPQDAVDCAGRVSARRNGLGIDPTVRSDGTTLPACPLPSGMTAGSGDSISVLAGDWNGTTFTPDNSAAANAVKVTASRTIQFDLTNGFQAVTASAVEERQAVTGARVGSFAARLTAGSVLDQIGSAALGQAFGGSVDLASYNGLATAQVTLGQLLTADPTIGTPGAVASTSVSALKLFNATITALTNQGNTTAAFQLGQLEQKFTNQSGLNTQVSLAQLFGLGTSSGDGTALSATANVLEMINTTGNLVDIANGTNFVTVNPTTITIPGVGSISVKASLISAPQDRYPMTIGDSVSDTQATVEADVTIPNINVANLLTGTLTLPITINAANGRATITAIQCGAGLSPSGSSSPVTMSAQTSAVTAKFGSITGGGGGNPVTVGTPGQLGTLSLGGLVGVTVSDGASAQVLAAASRSGLQFTTDFIANLIGSEAGRGDPSQGSPAGALPFTVGTGSINSGSLSGLQTSPPTLTATGSISPALQLLVNAAGGLTGLASTLATGTINPVLTGVASTLLPALAPVLGIDVGGADIWNTVGVNCASAQLVQ